MRFVKWALVYILCITGAILAGSIVGAYLDASNASPPNETTVPTATAPTTEENTASDSAGKMNAGNEEVNNFRIQITALINQVDDKYRTIITTVENSETPAGDTTTDWDQYRAALENTVNGMQSEMDQYVFVASADEPLRKALGFILQTADEYGKQLQGQEGDPETYRKSVFDMLKGE